MKDQFDLEQNIMGCWQVTSDLDVLLEELCENSDFTTDQASNFVLGLSTIYEAKFQKLFRTFEEFLKGYYSLSKRVSELESQLDRAADVWTKSFLEEEMNFEIPEGKAIEDMTLDELFRAQEEASYMSLMDEHEPPVLVEDEFAPR